MTKLHHGQCPEFLRKSAVSQYSKGSDLRHIQLKHKDENNL